MNFKRHKKADGFTLIEILIYLGLISIFTVVITNLFLSESKTWLSARASRDASDAGRLITERIIHEIRLARSVDILESVLDSNPGKLVLETFESATSTQESIVEIFLEGNEIKIRRNYGESFPLSGGSISVTNLVFYHLLSPNSELVRVELGLTASKGKVSSQKTFISSSVLKGSY